MSLISLIVALAVLGVIIWVITQYIPMDARIKNLIIIIAVIFIAVWFLQEMGWIGSIRGAGNEVAIR